MDANAHTQARICAAAGLPGVVVHGAVCGSHAQNLEPTHNARLLRHLTASPTPDGNAGCDDTHQMQQSEASTNEGSICGAPSIAQLEPQIV